MIRLTCQRCGAKAKVEADGYGPNGWAYPHSGGCMCPKCYDGLQRLREKYHRLECAAWRKWLAKGKK